MGKTEMSTRKFCPICGKEQFYSNKYDLKKAIKKNVSCLSCVRKGKLNPMYGKTTSEKQKKAASEADRKRWSDLEEIKKLTERMTGESNPFYGRNHTKETKEKMSAKQKGHHRSPQTEFKKGHSKGKTFEELFGKEKAEKTKQKMRINALKQFENGMPEKTKKKLSEITTKLFKEGKLNHKLEKNPSWKGGKSFEPYVIDFNKSFKESIRKRDGYKCVVTDMSQDENIKKYGRKLAVHHWMYNKDEKNPFYFATVSTEINTTANFNRADWIDLFNGIMEEKYCEMLGGKNG